MTQRRRRHSAWQGIVGCFVIAVADVAAKEVNVATPHTEAERSAAASSEAVPPHACHLASPVERLRARVKQPRRSERQPTQKEDRS